MSTYTSKWRRMTHDEALDRCVQLEAWVQELQKELEKYNPIKISRNTVVKVQFTGLGACHYNDYNFNNSSKTDLEEYKSIEEGYIFRGNLHHLIHIFNSCCHSWDKCFVDGIVEID